MKTTQLLSIGALVATAAAQTLDSLPPCGKLCVNNMLEKASELGCASGDAACLCKNVDFAYGIRDCSTAVCGAEAAIPVIAYGEKYCGSTVASAATTIGSNPSGPTASPIVATITSGTQVLTSTLGFTTISSSSATASSISSLTSSIASSASSAIASLSSQINSISSQASSASESATSTSSSSGARQTVIAGLAAAAGLAGLIL